MIITTRYRDIPFEVAVKCFKRSAREPDWPEKWAAVRGTEIRIETPAIPGQTLYFKCAGPHYFIVGTENSGACPHIAEIGD